MPGVIEDTPTTGSDDRGGLYDYDVDAEDIFRQLDEDAERLVAGDKGSKHKAGDLGIDEEVKITKTRAPVAKLDTDRLLSDAGIPKLRRITKERLKFKGKGHEYKDVARMLNMYQFWLDDLYPRAKFADGLAMIEKLGHTKRLQVMRREWINEGKPKERRWEDEQTSGEVTEQTDRPSEATALPAQREQSGHEVEMTGQPQGSDDNDDDEEDGGLFLRDEEGAGAAMAAPPEDDLDALLAEDEAVAGAAGSGNSAANIQGSQAGHGQFNDNFAAEEEAMAELEGLW